MPKIPLVARVAFTHEGQALRPGEVFEATAIQAAALTYQRRASFAPKGASPEPVRSKRQYRRRDLTAED